jgi:hypothetical protein
MRKLEEALSTINVVIDAGRARRNKKGGDEEGEALHYSVTKATDAARRSSLRGPWK